MDKYFLKSIISALAIVVVSALLLSFAYDHASAADNKFISQRSSGRTIPANKGWKGVYQTFKASSTSDTNISIIKLANTFTATSVVKILDDDDQEVYVTSINQFTTSGCEASWICHNPTSSIPISVTRTYKLVILCSETETCYYGANFVSGAGGYSSGDAYFLATSSPSLNTFTIYSAWQPTNYLPEDIMFEMYSDDQFLAGTLTATVTVLGEFTYDWIGSDKQDMYCPDQRCTASSTGSCTLTCYSNKFAGGSFYYVFPYDPVNKTVSNGVASGTIADYDYTVFNVSIPATTTARAYYCTALYDPELIEESVTKCYFTVISTSSSTDSAFRSVLGIQTRDECLADVTLATSSDFLEGVWYGIERAGCWFINPTIEDLARLDLALSQMKHTFPLNIYYEMKESANIEVIENASSTLSIPLYLYTGGATSTVIGQLAVDPADSIPAWDTVNLWLDRFIYIMIFIYIFRDIVRRGGGSVMQIAADKL